jgi:outer membrane biosynthesis protein TonB
MKKMQSYAMFGCFVMVALVAGVGIGYYGMANRLSTQLDPADSGMLQNVAKVERSTVERPVVDANKVTSTPVEVKTPEVTVAQVEQKVNPVKKEAKINKPVVTKKSIPAPVVVAKKEVNTAKKGDAQKKSKYPVNPNAPIFMASSGTKKSETKTLPVNVAMLTKSEAKQDDPLALDDVSLPKEALEKNQKNLEIAKTSGVDKKKSDLQNLISTIGAASDEDLDSWFLPGGKGNKPSVKERIIPYPDQIRRKIGRNLPAIRSCYERDMGMHSGSKAKVVVEFTIGTDGRIADHSIGQSNLNNPAVEACIIRNLKSISFPEPSQGPVTVNYPFIFTGGE